MRRWQQVGDIVDIQATAATTAAGSCGLGANPSGIEAVANDGGFGNVVVGEGFGEGNAVKEVKIASRRPPRKPRPPVRRRSSLDEATLCGGFFGSGGGADEVVNARSGRGLNSWERGPESRNGSELSATESIGSNARAFFQTKLLQQQQQGNQGDNWAVGQRGKGGAAPTQADARDGTGGKFAGGGGVEGQRKILTLPTRLQQQQRHAEGTRRARTEEEVGERGSLTDLARPPPALARVANAGGRRSLVYADRPHSPTPEELAAVQVASGQISPVRGRFAARQTAAPWRQQPWQGTEQTVSTPPGRFGGGAVASSPPHCPSPFFAARRSRPFAGTERRGKAGTGSSGSSDGDGPSSTWCATVCTTDTSAAIPPAGAGAGAGKGRHTPPMWKASRPIVGLLRPSSSDTTGAHERISPADTRGRQDAYSTPPRPTVANVEASTIEADGGHPTASSQDRGLGGPECVAEVGKVNGGIVAGMGEAVAAAETSPPIVVQELRYEQIGLVRSSQNSPMSLPPMDGSGDAPQADDFGGMMAEGPGPHKGKKWEAAATRPAATAIFGDDDGGGTESIGSSGGGRSGGGAQITSLSSSSSSTMPATPLWNSASSDAGVHFSFGKGEVSFGSSGGGRGFGESATQQRGQQRPLHQAVVASAISGCSGGASSRREVRSWKLDSLKTPYDVGGEYDTDEEHDANGEGTRERGHHPAGTSIVICGTQVNGEETPRADNVAAGALVAGRTGAKDNAVPVFGGGKSSATAERGSNGVTGGGSVTAAGTVTAASERCVGGCGWVGVFLSVGGVVHLI